MTSPVLAQQWLQDQLLTEPGSTGAATTDGLFMFITWISIVSFVLLMGAMTWFVIRYRRAGGRAPIRSASHNTPLELTWSIGPLLILVVVFFWGFHGYVEKMSAPAGSEEIVIRGFKWGWDVTYDSGKQPSELAYPGVGAPDQNMVPVIKVPAGRPVRLRLYSSDVIHSFFIPDFRVKRDVMPNRYTSFWFETLEDNPEPEVIPILDETGAPVIDPDTQQPMTKLQYPRHVVYCAEYCGDSHSQMMAFIEPVPEEVFQEEKYMVTVFPTKWEFGEYIWQRQCSTCHSVDGSGGTGPTWKDIWGKTHKFSNAPDTVVDENYIRESIIYPQVKLREGYGSDMNSFVLTEEEFEGIIAYIKYLSGEEPE